MPSKKGKSERIRKLPWRQATDPETGRNICRHWDCEKPVGKGLRSWCGDECRHDAYMQSQPQYQKDQVEKRDKEVCCDCGLDCREVQSELRVLKGLTGYVRFQKKVAKRFGLTGHEHQAMNSWACTLHMRYYINQPDLRFRDAEKAEKVTKFLRRAEKLFNGILKGRIKALHAAGFDRGRKTLWDMDHIVEIVNGGSYKLENLATRCQPCHKKKTAQLAADRALERKGILELDFNEKDQ